MYLEDIYHCRYQSGRNSLQSLCLAEFAENGLPIGIQLIGAHLTEKKLLNAAYQIGTVVVVGIR
jgi:hypothetical protein